jgi:hypothetical protein
MENQIERMNRMRKNILWVTLLGTVAAFEIFMYPSFVSIYLITGAGWLYRILPGALLLWSLMILVFLLRHWIGKRRSRAHPSVKARKRISPGLAIVSIITFFVLVQFLMSRSLGYSAWSYRYMEIGLLFWITVCVVMLVVFRLYKNKLKKDPLLRLAVNDERIRENWLKAYRFGFLMILGITVVWKWSESSFSYELMFRRLRLPEGPWLIFFGALISLLGSFLYYNREARDE